MRRFQKIYVEISNVCNLRCSFCPGTRRKRQVMPKSEFASLLPKLQPWTDFLYFHIMGEPLCHPQLAEFLSLAGQFGFKVILTTNGTLLAKQQETLIQAAALHKVNISLHAFEANDLDIPFSEYLRQCFAFGQAAQGQKLVVYRLWNQGGAEARNEEILSAMEAVFPKPWNVQRRGTEIGNRIFLEYGEKFDWPDLAAQEGGELRIAGSNWYSLRWHCGSLLPGSRRRPGPGKSIFRFPGTDLSHAPSSSNLSGIRQKKSG